MRLSSIEPGEIAKHIIGLFMCLSRENYSFDKRVWNITCPQFDLIWTSFSGNEEACPLLPAKGGLVSVSEAEMQQMHVKPIKEDMTKLLVELETNHSYRDTVYDVFERVITRENIMSLTYNAIFGKFWRNICKRRNDPRREALVEKMGKVVSELPATTKETIKTFIECSYDQSDIVIERISKVSDKFPCLVYEGPRLDRKEIMEVCRSCNPGVLRNVSKMLTSLQMIQKEPVPEVYVPSQLAPRQLFETLPHLLCPGTVYSLRPAAILAAIVVVTESMLYYPAEEFLFDVKGNWIDFALPENSAFEFIKLMLRIPQFLTETELERMTLMRNLGSIAMNGLTDLEIVIPGSAHKAVRPDRKVTCNGCRQDRSFTLITKTGICGLCAEGITDVPEPKHDNNSVWCECHTCQVNYAVIRPETLNVRPKCHFCRQNDIARSKVAQVPFKTCQKCHNKFLWQTADSVDAFVCPICEAGEVFTDTHSITLKTLLKQNGTGLAGLQADVDELFDGRSGFKKIDTVKRATVEYQPMLRYNNKRILNESEIRERVERLASCGMSERGTCDLCFEEVLPSQLRYVCGRKGCKSRACEACLTSWYGQTKPGGVCLTPNLLCPFCKKKPAPKILGKYNRELSIVPGLQTSELDPTWYHGWCKLCYSIKPAVEKVCSQDVPALQNFECEDCQASKYTLSVKDCPSCGVTTQRMGGCAHITCRCGAHWCWICGEQSTDDNIYDHIGTHGDGYGFDYEPLDDDDGYYSDY